MEKSRRIKEVPPYLFAEIDKIKAEQIARGVDVIDLTIGDPDLPTPSDIISQMKKSIEDPKNHAYPSYIGMPEMRQAVAKWYQNRFKVKLDPETEVIILIGSKEGIAHLPLAFIDNGDYGLVPDPGYPVYKTSILFAGGIPHFLPLLKENHYLPDLDKVPQAIRNKSKLLFLNYPNNPTSATAGKEFFEQAIAFCRNHNIIICHDAAYTEIYFNEKKPLSFLEVEGAKEVGIEFHSLSKTFNMAGWRIGFAVGNSEIIAALGQIKTNIDSGCFKAIQEAGITALQKDLSETKKLREIYQERKDLIMSGLKKTGLEVEPPAATFYVWLPVPDGYTSMEFATHLLNQTGILTTPGNGFGPSGEGFIRMSLTASTERIKEAANRLASLSL
ncbi:MAG: LL-diaminopimelate aminotransferase [Proteobacteria bacterium]|nr:LL-diaminopimelate aminotransferase [Pseudomonadota bacterium]